MSTSATSVRNAARSFDADGNPLPSRGRSPSIIVVGAYPPSTDGSATYAAHLVDALISSGWSPEVIRVADEGTAWSPAPVVFDWRHSHPYGALAAAAVAERYDVTILHHEFGVFPGKDGDQVVEFLRAAVRPVIAVLHAILDYPTPNERRIIDAIINDSTAVVVHSDVAARRVLATYDVVPGRVVVVPRSDWPSVADRFRSLVDTEVAVERTQLPTR